MPVEKADRLSPSVLRLFFAVALRFTRILKAVPRTLIAMKFVGHPGIFQCRFTIVDIRGRRPLVLIAPNTHYRAGDLPGQLDRRGATG